ncbi:SulP family inorganic anion transporter [Candidatus Competibacter phosphatis]|uniref:SulP family inorganic anion transporter n=2 Tax=Candidatus Competibacter phosphatis TaxID=221280 RepID=A0ABX1TN57_9GAMM|nr:SulP family inorganic anion transporter [Candidatus Competibacter phosphatis]
MARLARLAPGVPALLRYRFAADFRHDLVAGISVAAVALPVAVAYAELAGFDPVVGLYSCILPLVAYALFGTSRQLMVNPDAATCAMIAAAITPLAAGDPALYGSLAILLTFFTGLFCIAASFLRLGALADFLSKPILVGFLNGVAISILLGQIGKLFGFAIESGRIIPRLLEFIAKLPQTHGPTLAVGLGSFAVLLLARRFLPRWPAALITLVVAGIAVAVLKLDGQGVAVLGAVPAGLPLPRWPTVSLEHLPALLASAAGLALVLFSSGVLTARSFAAKNRYEIDVDREFAAFGAANIAAALSQGFAVTGAASRTAMADSAGGRTQVTGLVAAATIATVLLFLTGPLRYVPIAALGVVLVFAAFSLFDIRALRDIWKIDRREVGLSVLTMLGVVAVGAINAILIAVALALVRFVKLTARPRDEVLGQVDGLPGFHSVERHPGARTFSGLALYRFDGPITFFNAAYFKQRALAVADAAGPELQWFVIDAIPISHIDVTGLYVLRDLREALEERGITLILAGRKTELLNWLQEIGLYRSEHKEHIFPTLRQALKAYRRETRPADAPPDEE